MSKNSLKSKLQFAVLAAGGGAIFYVLFSRASYYDAFIQAMDVTNEEFGILFSAYAWVAAGTYFLGGLVADKVSPRILMTISFVGTGILNVWFGLFPSYNVCLFLYISMGITTTVTFWAAMLKATRQYGQEIKSESKAFGYLQTGRGIFEIVAQTVIAFGFNLFANAVLGLRFVIWTYGGILIILGIISWFVFDDEKGSDVLNKENFLQLIVQCIKNPDMWLLTLMAMGGYNIGSCIGSYMGNMATSMYGATIGMAAYIGTMNAWLKPVGSFAASYVGEKKGPSFVIMFTGVLLTIISLVFAFVNPKPSMIIFFLIVVGVEIMLTGAFRSHKYATVREAKIPMNLTGTAFGFVATIVYTTDAFMPPIIGKWLDIYDPVTAYRRLFYVLVFSGIVTLVTGTIFIIRNRKNIQDVLEEEKLLRLAEKTENQ
ncbi:MAG: MFS transporter [Eubacteriaceae bacterium]|nr:MFS transporter [Eubacteriaceae bacterium]